MLRKTLGARATLVLGLLSLATGSCGDVRPTWVKAPLAGHLRFARNTSSPRDERIFSDRGVAITTIGRGEARDARELRKIFEGKLPVVATVPSDAPLAHQLAADPAAMAFHESDDGLSYALLSLENTAELDGLAAAVHAVSHPACGGVAVLNLSTLAQVADEPIPPVLPEVVPLQNVKNLASEVSRERIEKTIAVLESRGTRHHASETGLKTPETVKALFQDAIAGYWTDATFELVDHASYAGSKTTAQQSLVVTLPGSSDDATTVVLGAHLDSINNRGSANPAPGADDDASGVATLIETAHVLASHGVRFTRRVEFHFYAAEEVGLIGSRHLAQTYRAAGRKVAAMMQMDMNAYAQDASDQTIHLVIDDTDLGLRRSEKDLLTGYLGGDFLEERLSAGTSDHRSWQEQGFRTVFPFESPVNYNKSLHTENDTLATINNLGLSERFAALGVTYLAHHAGIGGGEAASAEAAQAWRTATPRDLKLAVTSGTAEGTFQVAIATSDAVKKVELCIVEEAGGMGCTKARIEAVLGKAEGGRRFYGLTEEMKVSEGARVAVFGYDGADGLIVQRSVRLVKP